MKLAVIYIMELFPCYGRELCLVGGGHMLVSEQETVNYPSVEVKKLSLAGTFLDQKLCFDCRKKSHNIFPLLSCGSELLHRFAFSFFCKI